MLNYFLAYIWQRPENGRGYTMKGTSTITIVERPFNVFGLRLRGWNSPDVASLQLGDISH